MKAMLVRRYGGPEVFESGEVPSPRPGPGEILVRVRRNSGPWAWTETLFNAAQERRLKRYAPALERALPELLANQGEEGSEGG